MTKIWKVGQSPKKRHYNKSKNTIIILYISLKPHHETAVKSWQRTIPMAKGLNRPPDNKNESPRVTRTNHRGWQGRVTREDENGASGKTKKSSGKAKNILLTIIQKTPVVLTCPSKGLYPDKLRPLPGQVEAFTCSAKGLYTEWGWPKCETRSLAPKVVKIRKQAAPSPHTTIRQKAQVVRL